MTSAGLAPDTGLTKMVRGLFGLSLPLQLAILAVVGALSALAHAPTYWLFLLPLGFGLTFALLSARTGFWGAFATVQAFAWGHFSAGMYWLASPLTLDLGAYWWGIPFAVLGIPGVIAAVISTPVALAWVLICQGADRPLGWRSLLILALAWACGDWLRSWVLTGLPWNVTGYVWGFDPVFMQTAAWWGPFGLSFLTAFASGWACLLLVKSLSARQVALAVLPSIALAGFLFLAGQMRLALAPAPAPLDLQVGLVQPNAKQQLSRTQDQIERAIEDLAAMSRALHAQSGGSLDAVVWSEGATGLELYRNPLVRRAIEDLAADGMVVITGASRLEQRGPTPPYLGGPFDVSNTLAVVGPGGVEAEHDKAHLVPFGEYVPLRQLISLPNLSLPGVDFVEGAGLRTLHSATLPPFGPLICYEAIFPGRSIERTDRPQWLVNITTDGWYGDTTGPHQHYVSVGFRAVEEGLPLVRTAGTGISGAFDAYGRQLGRVDLFERGSFWLDLPQGTRNTPLYAAGGQQALMLLFWLFLIVLSVRGLSRLNQR